MGSYSPGSLGFQTATAFLDAAEVASSGFALWGRVHFIPDLLETVNLHGGDSMALEFIPVAWEGSSLENARRFTRCSLVSSWSSVSLLC